MVAFTAAFHGFIFLKPLTTVNQSHQQLVMSVMADGSKKRFVIKAITLSLLVSLLLEAMLNQRDLYIDKTQLLDWNSKNVYKEHKKIVIMLHFPFIGYCIDLTPSVTPKYSCNTTTIPSIYRQIIAKSLTFSYTCIVS